MRTFRRLPPSLEATQNRCICEPTGKLDDLKQTVEFVPEIVNARDENGWQPIHEAVRTGDPEIVRFLLEKGADINSRTENGNGGSVLYWARQYHEDNDPVIVLLESQGAKYYAPRQRAEL